MNAYALKGSHYMQMHDHCPVCGQATDIEVGFYYGTGYVSYIITIFLSGITFLLWWLLIGVSINDNRVFYWLGFNTFLLIVLQPPLMRFSRSLWISWFVKYDENWEKEKSNRPRADYKRAHAKLVSIFIINIDLCLEFRNFNFLKNTKLIPLTHSHQPFNNYYCLTLSKN